MIKVLREKSDQTMEMLIPETISPSIHKKTLELLGEYRSKTVVEKTN